MNEPKNPLHGRTWPDVVRELFSGAPSWIISLSLLGTVFLFGYAVFFMDECRLAALMGREQPCQTRNSSLVGKNYIPKGAVVAFDRQEGCPVGWEADISVAAGRVVVGVKPNSKYELPYKLDKPDYQTGGAETHELEIDEMPEHNHTRDDGSLIGYWARVEGDSPTHGFTSGSNRVTSRQPVMQGKSKPHENMPPYVALHYCKKE